MNAPNRTIPLPQPAEHQAPGHSNPLEGAKPTDCNPWVGGPQHRPKTSRVHPDTAPAPAANGTSNTILPTRRHSYLPILRRTPPLGCFRLFALLATTSINCTETPAQHTPTRNRHPLLQLPSTITCQIRQESTRRRIRHEGTKAQRHKDTKAQRHRGTKTRRKSSIVSVDSSLTMEHLRSCRYDHSGFWYATDKAQSRPGANEGRGIRSSKSEARSTKQSRMTAGRNQKRFEVEVEEFRTFEFWSFGFVWDLVLRASRF